MNTKNIFLILGSALCIAAIIIITLKGTPRDETSLRSVSEVGESLLHSVHKAGSLISSLTDAEEIALGDKLHAQMYWTRTGDDAECKAWELYVSAVGMPLMNYVNRSGIPYCFHVVPSPWVNAFAGAGGHIYITTGLLKELKSEAELAAVLGHEIVHVDARHAVGVIESRAHAGALAGALVSEITALGQEMLFRPGYSEVQEDEADSGGVYLAGRAGYHPLAVINAFQTIDKAELPGHAVTPVGDTLAAVSGMIDRFFGTHPLSAERIEKIRGYVAHNRELKQVRRFYIGQRNYAEKTAMWQKRYSAEFSQEYALTSDTQVGQKEPRDSPRN